MSYTVVVDEQFRERQFENRLNAAMRRCKIGKVRYRQHKWADLADLAKIRPKRETFFIDSLPWVNSPILGHANNA